MLKQLCVSLRSESVKSFRNIIETITQFCNLGPQPLSNKLQRREAQHRTEQTLALLLAVCQKNPPLSLLLFFSVGLRSFYLNGKNLNQL